MFQPDWVVLRDDMPGVDGGQLAEHFRDDRRFREVPIVNRLAIHPTVRIVARIGRGGGGENVTFRGEEDLLRSRGVTVEMVQDARCIAMMRRFIHQQPGLWNEDIGV